MAQATSTSQDQTIPPASSQAPVQAPVAPDVPNVSIGNIDQNQLMTILRHLPNVFTKLAEGNKDSDAAQTLSNLSQANANFPLAFQLGQQPNLGALQHPMPIAGLPIQTLPAARNGQAPLSHEQSNQEGEDHSDGDEGTQEGHSSNHIPGTSVIGGTRRGRNPAIGSDEWARQRKDNHKEVERRRRGNINEGINELGRIVPNGSGEKAKGAILARAVQYIHHLKENEARNIEKWTLEKLLMDQAMGDLQSQLGDAQTQNAELQRVKGEMERQMGEMQTEILTLRKQLEGNDKVEVGSKRRSPDDGGESSAEKKQKTAE
ncbi:hypothetical protein ONZ45_g17351 [Pleurotus djamor]|nr:hypothetical protein ONZ45_g17351 [Pleurotus djamor]